MLAAHRNQLKGPIVMLEAARNQLEQERARFSARLLQLEGAGDKSTKKLELLKAQVDSLQQAIKNGFPDAPFRIWKLSFLASRGREVTALLEQLLTNLQDPKKAARFREFDERGLVDAYKIETDQKLVQSAMTQMKREETGQLWAMLTKVAEEADSTWKDAYNVDKYFKKGMFF